MEESRICKTCSNKFVGRFCNICGEKVIEYSDKSFLNFAGNLLSAFTFLDNKFLHTLRLMLLKPGFVTRQFIDGIRVPYVRPLSMFFVVNMIYFLFPLANTFTTPLDIQMNQLPHREIATAIVEEKLSKDQVTLEEFTPLYDQQSASLSKLLLIVFVFIQAIPIMILNFTRKRFFIDHLTASLEYNSIIILVVLTIIPATIILLNSLFQNMTSYIGNLLLDQNFSIIAAFICATVFFSIERRVYNQNILMGIAKSIAVVAALYYTLQTYRAVLFFVTIWTL